MCPPGGLGDDLGDVGSPGEFWIEHYSKVFVVVDCGDGVLGNVLSRLDL